MIGGRVERAFAAETVGWGSISCRISNRNQPVRQTVSRSSRAWYHVRLGLGITFVRQTGAGGLRFKSRACQIRHSVDNSSPLLQHFERNCVASRRSDAKMSSAISIHALA